MPASSDSDGIVKVITKTVTTVPNWVKSLSTSFGSVSAIESFVSERTGFKQAVLFVVASWVISGILNLTEAAVGITLMPFNILLSAISKATDDIGGAGGTAGDELIGAVEGITSVVASMAATGGAFAPVIVVLFWTLMFIVAFAIFDWLTRYFLGISFRSVIP